MKKIYIILCAAIAALALAGCQKENDSVQGMDARTHTIVFTAEKMIDTRTAIASEGDGVVSYKWIEGDDERMEILEFYEVEVEKDGQTKIETRTNKGTITGMTLSNNDKSATFTAEFTGDVPVDLLGYQAAYAGSFATTSHNPKIPAAQNPLPDTFDPAADVLVSDLFQNGRETNSFVFNMTRKVSVNKMTLKGLTPGEVISTVTFESDKQHAATYVLNSGNYSGEGKKLTFTFSSNNTVPSSGEFPVYFTTAPVQDATFTVSVTTDQNKYRKTSAKTISFATGEVRRFGVNLSGCEVPDGRTFTLVDAVNKLVIGSDVVIAAHGTTNLAMSTTQNANNRGSVEATKSSDWSTISVDDQVVQIFTLTNGTTSGTYAFLCKNGAEVGNYIYAASSKSNWLRSQDNLDDNASWTVSISNKEATITAQGENTHNILRRNGDLFSCYASGQQPVFIYQATGLPAANLSFTEASYTFTLGDTDYTNFTGQALNNPNNISDITWTSSNPDLATVDSDGVITWVADATGTTTITASFAGDNFFAAGNASYTITVNAATTVLTLPFLETFDDCTGTTGWDGSAGNGTFMPDYEDWLVANAYGAGSVAKFGTGSKLGSAKTPEIYYSGNATLTFKAGAWNGNSENTTLKLSLSSGSLYSDAALSATISSVTLVKGAWTEYTVYLKDLVSPFTLTFEGETASNSRFFLDDVSIVAGIEQPAASFGASIANTDNVLAAGGTKTINVTGNVSWTASATNNATVSPSSGTGAGSVTVTIPENETSSEKTYSVTISTSADVDPDSYSFTITQDAAPSVVNESTESDPYTPAEAAALADELSGATLDDVYVYGIIKSANYYTSSNTWNLVISADGSSEGSQFTIYKAAGEDFVAGDAVEFKGTLKKYNSTAELDEGNTLIAQLHKPTISPNGGSFTTSQSVSIAVNTSTTGATGAAIHYTTDGNDPTASSTTYSSAFSVSETTTVKAVATKGVLITGVASATFTITGQNPTTHYYTKVTSTADITSGDYLIVYESNSVAFNGGLSTLDNASNTINVTIDTQNKRIEANATTNAAKFTIDVANGTLLSASGYYIGVSSQSNGLKTSDDPSTYKNSFSIDGSGNAVISAIFTGSTMTLRFNNASDQQRFRYYKSGQQAIQLYKYN